MSDLETKTIGAVQKYELSNAKSLLLLATEVTKFIKERGLNVTIKGKDFAQVEAWTFAGASMGLIPIPVSIEDLSQAGEIKYKATVELMNVQTGQIVGRGFAICSNKESNKRNFEEYAIASMAQTRATGKAFRIPLGWLIKAAGFEATPAEEADSFERRDMPTEEEKKLLIALVYSSTLDDDKKMEALATINGCDSYPLYQKIQHRLESLQTPFDQIPNPNQRDINNHLKKTVHA